MSIHLAGNGSFTRPSPQSAEVTTFPAPTGGVDTRQNLATSPIDSCIYSYNLEASEYGMRIRQGYREWQTEVTTGTSDGVRTIIPFTGQPSDRSDDRLFAVTLEGIWDCTIQADPPVLVYPFVVNTSRAGWGVYTHYITDAGEYLLLYADLANGLVQYSANTDLWTVPVITGIDPGLIDHVMVHKQRIWFCQRDSANGYYLGVGSVAGEVTPFYFGTKFQHGGDLVGLYNWSVDGGVGIDDHLVAVSRGGDVLPYKGSDPSAEWDLVGTYFIGAVPDGNKIGTEYGGDLQLLSSYGISAMSDLLRGVEAKDAPETSIAYKITPLIREAMKDLIDVLGWELKYAPDIGLFIVNTPIRPSQPPLQYVLSRATSGWSFWRDVPMVSMDTWLGATMVGTPDNRVLRMDVIQDNVALDAKGGVPIDFSMLTAYQNLGSPAQFKRGELVRPTFVSKQIPSFATKVLYDFEVGEISDLATPPTTPLGLSVWDAALWDVDVWGSGILGSTNNVLGSYGIGRNLAIAIKGKGFTGTTLASMDLVWRTGGVL